MDPFQALLALESQCKAHSAHIPWQAEPAPDWIGIQFKSSNFNFVCPLLMVNEVLKGPLMVSVPGVQPWLRGIANLRGQILPVTDLQGFITGQLQVLTPMSRIMVIKSKSGIYGFSVEHVFGIRRFFSEEIKPVPEAQWLQSYRVYASGAFELHKEPWVILDFDKMIHDPEFYHLLVKSKFETVDFK